jgi:hypothetical protein
MGCIKTVMILFWRSDRSFESRFLLPLEPAAWNCSEFVVVVVVVVVVCVPFWTSEIEKEEDKQYKEDSERKGQGVNPGVVVLRHGTLPPSLFIPLFRWELLAVVSQKAQYTSGVVFVSLFASLFHDCRVFVFCYNVTIFLSFSSSNR